MLGDSDFFPIFKFWGHIDRWLSTAITQLRRIDPLSNLVPHVRPKGTQRRGKETCLYLHSQSVAELPLELRPPDSTFSQEPSRKVRPQAYLPRKRLNPRRVIKKGHFSVPTHSSLHSAILLALKAKTLSASLGASHQHPSQKETLMPPFYYEIY